MLRTCHSFATCLIVCLRFYFGAIRSHTTTRVFIKLPVLASYGWFLCIPTLYSSGSLPFFHLYASAFVTILYVSLFSFSSFSKLVSLFWVSVMKASSSDILEFYDDTSTELINRANDSGVGVVMGGVSRRRFRSKITFCAIIGAGVLDRFPYCPPCPG